MREISAYDVKYGLVKLDYSTLSRKGKEIPYQIALEILEDTMRKAKVSYQEDIQKNQAVFL